MRRQNALTEFLPQGVVAAVFEFIAQELNWVIEGQGR
jgi:hypothetical protein